MFVVPNASKEYNEFKYQYLHKYRKDKEDGVTFRQINDNEYIYVSSFDSKTKQGYNFTLEHFEGNELKHKIQATKLSIEKKIHHIS